MTKRYEAIVIGASAGGIVAVSEIFSVLSATPLLPIFVALHIDQRSSGLGWLFSRKTSIVVHEAEDKEPIAPGKVYLAPPGYHLLVENKSELALSVDDKVRYARPSIDVLFESAAEVYQSRLVAVLLTGASDDGAIGMRTVKSFGGLTIVQDPAEAEVKTMPEAALAATQIDEILSLQEIGARLMQLCALSDL